MNLDRVNRFNNFILNSLPQLDCDRLQGRLEPVELHQGDILHQLRAEIDYVYFPTSGLLSWVNATPAGEEIEMGVTGSEGMAGIPLFLGGRGAPWRIQVQIPGHALRLRADQFTAFLNQSPTLQTLAAAFTYLKIVQLSQSVICNRFHRVEERLCRWLLNAQDCTNTPELLLTRDILAQMIGAGRPAVSLVTSELQLAGLIQTARGRITILDRKGMEGTACECYHLVKQELRYYLTQQHCPS